MGVGGVALVAWVVLGLAAATPYGGHWNQQPSYSSSSQGCATKVHHVTKIVGETVTETVTETTTETSVTETQTETETLISATTATTTSIVSQTITEISLTTTTETVTSTTAATTTVTTATATVTQADCVTVAPSLLLDPRYDGSEAGRSSLDIRVKNRKSSISGTKGWVWSS